MLVQNNKRETHLALNIEHWSINMKDEEFSKDTQQYMFYSRHNYAATDIIEQ